MSTHFFFPYEYSPEKERAFKIFSYCFLKPLEPKLLAIFNNFIIITYFLVRLKDVSKCTILDTTLSAKSTLLDGDCKYMVGKKYSEKSNFLT